MDNLQSNREGVTLVWFDPTLKEGNVSDFAFPHLRSLNDYILIYSDESLYMDYLKSEQKRNDHIVAVLHNAENLDETHDCEQVQAILLILPNESDENKNMSKIKTNYTKVFEIFEDRNSMLEKLQQVIIDVEQQFTQNMTNIFSTFNPEQRCLRDIKTEWVSFIWRHAFKSKHKKIYFV